MTTQLLTIFTRTPLHVGAGSSVGAVDQPIIRERHTRFPVIPGSSLKGVLADLWNEELVTTDGEKTKTDIVRSKDGIRLFGNTDTAKSSAGALLIGESKLLAFPVRSAKGGFAWITCPLALRRFSRDTGNGKIIENLPSVKGENAAPTKSSNLLLDTGSGGRKIILEEYPLALVGELPDAVGATLAKLSADTVWQEIASRLVLLSDELFCYFVENACEVAQHNRIDDRTGTVADGALFNQENVPSEAMFYSVLSAKAAGDIDAVAKKLSAENGLLQIGADMTTGLGWCSVELRTKEEVR